MTDAETEFGSSEYAKEILGALWGYPPEIDLEKEAALQKAIINLIQDGLVESVHDCSDGGIAVALAEKTFPKGMGARVELASRGASPRICTVRRGSQPHRQSPATPRTWRESKK